MRGRAHLGLLDLVRPGLACLDLGVAAWLGLPVCTSQYVLCAVCCVLCAVEERARSAGTWGLAECWAGWRAGWLVLVGRCQDQVGVAGGGKWARDYGASATVLACGTTLTEGGQQNRDKEKEDLLYRTMLCMHAWCMWMEHKLPDSAQSAGRWLINVM
jgi:hypothetical protein